MESTDWAQYMEATSGISKPWWLIQGRLKLRDWRAILNSETYLAKLHQVLIHPGPWWQGQEAAQFVAKNPPGERS